jgi:cell division protein FtsL
MKKDQRLHREPDRRVRRSLVVALATSALLAAAALTVVGVRLEQVHLGYRLDALRSERGRTQERIRQLEIEVATLRSPSRIEARARQIGLVVPAHDQIRLTKEYVAGGTGLAAARSRAASLTTTTRPPAP